MESREKINENIQRGKIERLLPLCAVCGSGKIVDELERRDDYDSHGLIFTVRCHGEKESVTISGIEFPKIVHGLKRGWAFANERIADGT